MSLSRVHRVARFHLSLSLVLLTQSQETAESYFEYTDDTMNDAFIYIRISYARGVIKTC